eukprot:jgi/Mesvir1/3176/Mv16334-RA.1
MATALLSTSGHLTPLAPRCNAHAASSRLSTPSERGEHLRCRASDRVNGAFCSPIPSFPTSQFLGSALGISSSRSLSNLPRRSTGTRCDSTEEYKDTSRLSKRYHEVFPPVPAFKMGNIDVPLCKYDPSGKPLDLIVVGCGPAGLSVAERVGAAGLSVLCIDPAPRSVWPNNYGVWVDEFEEMGFDDCFEKTWPQANVFLDEGDERRLSRPYARVDRFKLKRKILRQCCEHGVMFLEDKVVNVEHLASESRVTCSDGTQISAVTVLDATGFSRRLVKFDAEFNPGFQAAYGIMAKVESHPFPMDTMLFMDWRDDHLDCEPDLKKGNAALPSFLYAMPMTETRVFLEETSLVARPAVPFNDLKERMACRMQRLGIKLLEIEEDEYCLIPMGGVLPAMPQRVLGIGGTGGHVHPSTGYAVSRTLAAAPGLAQALVKELQEAKAAQGLPITLTTPVPAKEEALVGVGGSSGSVAVATAPVAVAAAPAAPEGSLDPSAIAAGVWAAVWDQYRLEQREFFTFGMDVLLQLDLAGTREFFASFFKLSYKNWTGFLSARLSLPELIVFGLSLFLNASNTARISLIQKGLPGLFVMGANVIKLKNKANR